MILMCKYVYDTNRPLRWHWRPRASCVLPRNDKPCLFVERVKPPPVIHTIYYATLLLYNPQWRSRCNLYILYASYNVIYNKQVHRKFSHCLPPSVPAPPLRPCLSPVLSVSLSLIMCTMCTICITITKRLVEYHGVELEYSISSAICCENVQFVKWWRRYRGHMTKVCSSTWIV